MENFWNSLLTEKSFKILQDLKKSDFDFILIGGWAAYLWTNLHKSKDIVVVVDLKQLDILKNNYNLVKNDNLKKYEIKIDEIDIDIYVPYYSKLGIPVEDIKKFSTKTHGFNVVIPELLLILKQNAEIDRKDSVKGEKDRIDILTLLFYVDIDFKKYHKILVDYNIKGYEMRIKQILTSFKDYKYLGLNPREYKLKKLRILSKL